MSTTTPGQADFLTFPGTAGQVISMALSDATFPSGNWVAWIYNPDGTQLLVQWALNSGSGLDWFLGATTLSHTGTYTIVLRGYFYNTGTATVTLYNAPPVTMPITPGGSAVTANLGTLGQVGNFTFSGTAGQLVSAWLTNVTVSNCGWTANILNPDGSTLVSIPWNWCSSGWFDTVSLPSTGTYTLQVSPTSNNTGNVTATMYNVVNTTAPITVNGSPITVSTTTPGQNAFLTFSGTSGQSVTVTLSNATFPSANWVVWVLNPDGSQLTVQWAVNSGPGTDAKLSGLSLTQTGTYTIRVAGYFYNNGSATVAVTSP